jgi:hypothetical protein
MLVKGLLIRIDRLTYVGVFRGGEASVRPLGSPQTKLQKLDVFLTGSDPVPRGICCYETERGAH